MKTNRMSLLPIVLFVAGLWMLIEHNQLDLIGWLLLLAGGAVGLAAGYVQGYARGKYRAKLISRGTMLLWRIGSLVVLIPIRMGLSMALPAHMPMTGPGATGPLLLTIACVLLGRSLALSGMNVRSKHLES